MKDKHPTSAIPVRGAELLDGSDYHKVMCDNEAQRGYTRLPRDDWGESMNSATARSHKQLAADDFKEPDVSEGLEFRQRI